jgi:ATP-binding cassette subfamily B protein RaxB
MNGLKFSGRRTTPLVLQSEAAECGLACLAMVAAHHGHRCDLATLRSRYSISLKGTTLTHLISLARQLDFASRPLRLDLDSLGKLQLPAILHWDLNHFVVLIEVRRQSVVILDPARGRSRLSFGELSSHFTGVALELTPTEQFKPRDDTTRIGVGALVGRLPGLGGVLAQLFLLGAALEVFSIVGPLLMQLILDQVVVAGDRDLLTVLAVGFTLITLIRVGVSGLRSWVGLYVGTKLNLHLLTRMFTHLLTLPMPFFARRHLGDLVSRFESLGAIRRSITTTALEIVIDGIMALVTAGMMFLYSWKLGLIVCGVTAVYGLLRAARYRPLREASRDQIVCSAKQQSNFLETVRGMQAVKLFSRELQRGVLYQNLAVDTFNAGIRVQKLRMIFHALNGVLFGVADIAVVWMGALHVLDGGFSVGMLFAFLSYKSQFTSRMSALIDNTIDLQMLELHTGRVADIALADAEPSASSLGQAAPTGRFDLELRQVSARYADADPYVLCDVSLKVEEGESVAIVGPSGCGKTTLLRVILGLLPVTEGEVVIGGVSMNRLGPAQFRSLIGTVMQDDRLFSGSIADNIAFFDPAADHGHIEACARMAAIHDDVVAMPMGYHTLIGDMGTVLSGGQKQRVLLARALYKRPKILLLDEATSHLDLAREKQVSEAVRHLSMTRVIVAHRPETIATADRVVSIDASGRVVKVEPGQADRRPATPLAQLPPAPTAPAAASEPAPPVGDLVPPVREPVPPMSEPAPPLREPVPAGVAPAVRPAPPLPFPTGRAARERTRPAHVEATPSGMQSIVEAFKALVAEGSAPDPAPARVTGAPTAGIVRPTPAPAPAGCPPGHVRSAPLEGAATAAVLSDEGIERVATRVVDRLGAVAGGGVTDLVSRLAEQLVGREIDQLKRSR